MRVLIAAAVLALSADALADECAGSVVNGRCYGTVLPDYTNPGARPADAFRDDRSGYYTSPRPGPRFEGTQFQNYTKPVIIPGRGLRWVDPNDE